MTNAKWWHNKRGEWFVVLQAILILLVLVGPRISAGAWGEPWSIITLIIGCILGVAGLLLCIAGALSLGRENLSPLPHPKNGASLVQTGAYSIVRHPIYAGLTIAAAGWALAWRSPITIAFAAILFVFFDIKARREERWLSRTLPQYTQYKRRVKKLIPFLY